MRDIACDPEAIATDAVALAELPGGTGHERVRIDWLNKRLPAGSVPLAHPLVAAVLRARRAVGLPDATGDAPTERIRADSIAAGAGQLQAVLTEILD